MNSCTEHHAPICVYIWGISVESVHKLNSLHCLDVINVITGRNSPCEIHQNTMGMPTLYARNSRLNLIANKVGKFNSLTAEGGRAVS